jgi:hypothetical protein
MKVKDLIKDFNRFILSIAGACVCVLAICAILNLLGVKEYDIWLVAGISILSGIRFFIYMSPTMVSFIMKKENIWSGTVIFFFRYIAILSFAFVLMIVILLSEFNLYKINPIIDVSIALVISFVFIVLLMRYLNSKRRE